MRAARIASSLTLACARMSFRSGKTASSAFERHSLRGSVHWSGGNSLTERSGRADRKSLRAPGARLAGGVVIGESGLGLCCDTPLQTRIESDDRQYSTNGLERLNKEVKRRADVVGIFPNEASIVRLVGAVLLEANDEWQLQHRYLSIEAFASVDTVDEEIDRFALAPPAASQILAPRAA